MTVLDDDWDLEERIKQAMEAWGLLDFRAEGADESAKWRSRRQKF